MRTDRNRALVALGIAAALALPAAATAKGPGGHGQSGKHGQGTAHSQAPHGGKGKGKGHDKGKHMRALVIKGTVKATGDGTLQVTVKQSNHHGGALRGQDVTFDVTDARIVVADANGDGTRDMADVAVGDRVVVKARIAKGETPDPAQPIAARQVVDRSAKADTGDDAGDDTSGDTGSGDDPSGDTGSGDTGEAGDDAPAS